MRVWLAFFQFLQLLDWGYHCWLYLELLGVYGCYLAPSLQMPNKATTSYNFP